MKQVLILFVAVVLQATVLRYLEVYGASLNAALVLLVWWGFSGDDGRRLFVCALVAGAVLDALSGAPFGVISLSLGTAVALAHAAGWFVPRENAVHLSLFIALATAWFSLASFALLNMRIFLAAEFSFVGLAAAVGYNVISGLCLYAFVKR